MHSFATPICHVYADDVLHVVEGMRPADKAEIFATQYTDDPKAFARQIMAVGGLKWLAWVDDEPVAAIGCAPMWPGVATPWCFGTDKFAHAALLLTRLGKRVIIPTAQASGIHRLEVKSQEGHTDAQGWLSRVFGCSREATHKGYGRDGSTFHTYVLEL